MDKPRATQPAHSPHAATAWQHSSTARRNSSGSRQQRSHRAQGTVRRETARVKSCRVQTAVLASAPGELSHYRPLPTMILALAHSPPLEKRRFLHWVVAVCCKLCFHEIHSSVATTTYRHITTHRHITMPPLYDNPAKYPRTILLHVFFIASQQLTAISI